MSRQLQLARGEAQLPNNRVLSYACGTGDLPPQPYKGRGAVEVVAAVDIMARQLWFVCWPPANHLLCGQIVTISVPAIHLARYDTCRYANHAWLSAVEC